ncbi:NAD-dependent epimerase/dehydratase family protein [Pedobacter nutrimenti]|uniref:Nucleoside-diphosphate-sugar epimerase n=1 Tax=Pedobacter nutrimenti TaxID=1241337 RepID=A0A318U5U7_9SPHI|nr:NAD-dependent epimerase/dehydratase family protein [Pedobacter nutrimenti]PYF68405.1 nucleoside-diphosphate-sugar epimerase [Pedobacter nutrimenti]
MHTILGAGGPTANALTRELIQNQQKVRLVSRRPSKLSGPYISWTKADLLNGQEILEATKGSSVIYLCAGLVYDKVIWQQQWPVIIQNVIHAAMENQARLIFFDNVYMYGLVDGPMTENTPYNPCSVKGEIRARVADKLMGEVAAGNIQASIARAADFYGTDSMNSFLDIMVLDKYAKKQSAQWIGKPDVLHNFTFIPDAGKGLYLLGQHPESDNQIWHMPTAKPLKGREFIELAASIYGVKPRFSTIGKFMLQMIGLFQKVVAGTVEMYYQYDHDYNFNSDKFEKAFNYTPFSYQQGITELSKGLYKPQQK